MNQTLTALARKEALKAIDVDSNGKMSAIEYLLWCVKLIAPKHSVCECVSVSVCFADCLLYVRRKYKKTVNAVVTAPQGVSPELIAAQKALEQVQKALEELLKMKAELVAAVNELKKEEDAFNGRLRELDEIANHPTSPRGVAKSKGTQHSHSAHFV